MTDKDILMFHYYLFYKPFGCVSARRDSRYPTVMDYFKDLDNPNLSPVGRPDRQTEGLLIITDDGRWNQLMTHPEILPSLHPEVQALTTHNRPDHPVVMGRITITEGRKCQIRRMLKTAGCCVIRLKRISIDNIRLDESLKPGEWKTIQISINA